MSTQPARKSPSAEPESRLERIRRRYQTGPAFISVERARYYTESWKATESQGLPAEERVALAMRNVYEKMNIHLDPDDRIAGTWCEHFLGIPLDVERGVFNSVLEAELDKAAMIKFRVTTLARGAAYMARKGMLRDFRRNQKISKQSGSAPLNLDFKTMSERRINPYQISPADKLELLRGLLPYWKGRATVDHLERELLASGLLSKEMRDFVLAIPGNTSRQVLMLSTCATIASYHAHLILDYGPVLKKGLLKMREEVEEKIRVAGKGAFLNSTLTALEGVIIYARRLADRVERELEITTDDARRAELERMLAVCRKVPLEPAETFAEAVQAMWTVKVAIEIAHPVYLHCLGRVDQDLWPYYQKDLREGRITREEAVELCAELLLKAMSQNIRPESNILSNFYHRFLGSTPVTLAGITRDGEDASNELTHVFLDAAEKSRAVTNVSVRVHAKTPDDVLLRVAEHLRRGTSTFSIFSDEMNIESMKRRGFSQEDANDYAVMGCVETTCPGKTGPMSANALQLSQLLNITLRNGDAMLMAGKIKGDGLQTGDPDSFKSFDELKEALYRQADYFIGRIVEGSNLRDKVFAEQLPAPMLSPFIDGCMENQKDVTAGGARYIFAGVSMVNAIANMIDSLLVIKKLVYEQKRVTMKQLIAAIDDGYIGHDDLKREIDAVPGKWGNGNAETDALAREVMERLFEMTYKYKTYNNGPVVAYIISMITHTIDGRLSIASPDGRRAATPYAASCNPYNVEKNGPTAALRSVAALPFEHVMGCAVNIKFHPTAVGASEAARKKWVSLIRAYFKLGGAQLQPTVVDAETLRDAQAEPDRHRDLIVKIGGYSTYFVDLGRDVQNEIIARTEHGGA